MYSQLPSTTGGRSSIRNLRDAPCRGDRDPLNADNIVYRIKNKQNVIFWYRVLTQQGADDQNFREVREFIQTTQTSQKTLHYLQTHALWHISRIWRSQGKQRDVRPFSLTDNCHTFWEICYFPISGTRVLSWTDTFSAYQTKGRHNPDDSTNHNGCWNLRTWKNKDIPLHCRILDNCGHYFVRNPSPCRGILFWYCFVRCKGV
jgi:hypothetical protein